MANKDSSNRTDKSKTIQFNELYGELSTDPPPPPPKNKNKNGDKQQNKSQSSDNANS